MLKDVREGKVSAQAAEAEYGVVIVSSSTGLLVDEQATAERRERVQV
ncbi:hypothetical protein LJK88_16150 [Paenibacillus sp. P26]|nr:hypothetical protein LJK88_16150 [Paenibacillus sp. P26]